MMMDCTYKTNSYKLPLAVFTRIANDGRNLLFAMTLINDETLEIFDWLLKSFVDIQKKLPKLFVTDGDPAICKAATSYRPTAKHFMCTWHLH